MLAFAPLLLAVFGFIALLDYYGYIETGEPKEDARMGAIVLFALIPFVLLLSWALLPRRYQILEDRIKIVLGSPFSFKIGFDTIKEARKATVWSGTMTINFVTSVKNVVEVLRSKGMHVAISPSNRELFLEELTKAMANWKKSQGIA